ncbi:MAG: hypothetical protein E7561_05965 [Ruminococcaceae bacterium]|nr:hypothetical protein [Oscillospiraceae bacterium]
MSIMSTTVLLGIGVVFAGLVCIVIICKITSAFCNVGAKKEEIADSAGVLSSATTPVTTVIENRQEIIAAISAAVAEELGTDIGAIRIHSFKKI